MRNLVLTSILALFAQLFFSTASFGQSNHDHTNLLYYFTKNVKWPDDKNQGDFIITVAGSDELANYLEILGSRKVHDRNIIIKSVSDIANAEETDILVLMDNQSSKLSRALQLAKRSNFLLVTNKPGYGKRGAHINIIVKDGRPAYELNLNSLTASGLKVSGQLAKLGS